LLEGAFPLPSDKATPEYSRMQQLVASRTAVLQKRASATNESRLQAEATQAAKTTKVEPLQRGEAGASQIAASGFSARGLANEQLLVNVYRGDFEKIDFERGDMAFGGLLGGYLNSYATRCERYLPKDAVEMTVQECATTSTPVNRYGTPVGPESCVSWRTRGTGKYADPALYAAQSALELQATREALRTTLQMMTNKNPIGTALGAVSVVTGMSNDADSVVQMNGCTSAGLKRFQENMRLFALGKQPVRLDGTAVQSVATEAPRPGTAFKDSDYGRLLEDLVAEQAKTWAMNRYLRGSIAGVVVSSRDRVGRPAAIQARYAFSDFGGRRSQGSVTLKFSDGLPECLLFSDLPFDCRTPNRKLVAAYESGGYQ
jgi:hypothetical protein